jgi:hypothetical protein
MKEPDELLEVLRRAVAALAGLFALALVLAGTTVYLFFFYQPPPEPLEMTLAEPPASTEMKGETAASDTALPALDAETGFIVDTGWELVKTNCTGCHAASLVTQNKATREGWEGMIRWMQRTQKLWELGENETAILDYLAKNYAPENKGRRPNLAELEWYELNLEE